MAGPQSSNPPQGSCHSSLNLTDAVAGSAVGVEEVGQVAFTFRGLWVQEVISTSEDKKGEE